MVAIRHAWEYRLVMLAYEARSSAVPQHTSTVASPDDLQQAYARCEAITAQHSRSFHLASSLLPRDKRRAVRALYAFCRRSDDLVDHPGNDPQGDLARWRAQAVTGTVASDDPQVLAWRDTMARYRIPAGFASQLLDGVSQDLTRNRYQTFDELAVYCYGVASTVGLMSMQIIGTSRDDALPYAVKLGVALQMTNILRDVAEDWRRGRLYLPLEELAAHHLDEQDVDQGMADQRWREFMRFQVARTRQLYQEAQPGIALLSQDGRLSIAAASEFYQGILDDIEAHEYDVFSRRAHLTGWQKLKRVPALWWRTRSLDRERTAPVLPSRGLLTLADLEG